MKITPTFEFENQHHGLVAGIDEAGRGPLAGPVVAAAIILDRENLPSGLADSKALTEKRREEIAIELHARAQVSVGIASVEEIDELNILQATMLAMTRAADALPIQADHFLIDGNRAPKLAAAASAIIKGDAKSLSIAAASIIAKTTRDKIMRELSEIHPEFFWAKNKGYGSKMHIEAIEAHGPTQHHRRSFAPIRNMLCAESIRRAS
ncbi:MAG: ribonuclease HII [Marinicaulis sp.]|nr:ribonuclease HII [Marinicaulis sp.]